MLKTLNVKRAATNGVTLLLSAVVGLLLCEGGARLVLNPADYLSPESVKDDILGMTIAPNSAGFDAWGFRNEKVPSAVDVVAIGDSHTYGNTATMSDAWPSVLARSTKLSVYNLGLGGYGPNQYFHLLTTRALQLHPKVVLCGLYMGDDFENAFTITHGLNHWSSLRKGQWKDVNPDIWDPPEQASWSKGTRNWLSRNSVLYRLVVHGPLLGKVKERLQFTQVSANADPLTTSLVVDDRNIREAFRPVGMVTRLDQKNDAVREGMRITFRLLEDMNLACRQNGCRFAVVIIPTKEMVFSEYLEKDSRIHLSEAIHAVIANERLARQATFAFLDGAGIAYVDTLPALARSAGSELYARTTRDMHPSRNGYKVIGETVAASLKP